MTLEALYLLWYGVPTLVVHVHGSTSYRRFEAALRLRAGAERVADRTKGQITAAGIALPVWSRIKGFYTSTKYMCCVALPVSC